MLARNINHTQPGTQTKEIIAGHQMSDNARQLLSKNTSWQAANKH